MISASSLEQDQFQRMLGARDERIRQLEQMLNVLREQLEIDAKQWRQSLRHRDELAEWLVDAATNESGFLIKPNVNAGLQGESFVPCSFVTSRDGRRFQIDLVSTEYEVKEVEGTR